MSPFGESRDNKNFALLFISFFFARSLLYLNKSISNILSQSRLTLFPHRIHLIFRLNMLRTCWYLAIIAILYAVRSTDAANCTATTFQQQMSAVQLAASKIIAQDYATETKAQIVDQLMKQYNGTVVSFDYTVTQVGDNTTISYKIILACNETTVTVLPDGTQKTSQVVSSVNKTQVQNSISAGLSSRMSCRPIDLSLCSSL